MVRAMSPTKKGPKAALRHTHDVGRGVGPRSPNINLFFRRVLFSGKWTKQLFHTWHILARHTPRLGQYANGLASLPIVFLHYEADIADRSPQPDDPSCLQHLIAWSRTTMAQAWKDAARLQAELSSQKVVTRAAYRQWSEDQDFALAA